MIEKSEIHHAETLPPVKGPVGVGPLEHYVHYVEYKTK